jgi:hypothetical protein
MKLKKVFLVFLHAVILFIFVGVAQADVLIAVDGNVYQNTTQNPCVIYGPGNCPNPAGWVELGDTQGNFNLTTGPGPNAAGDNVITAGELRAALGVGSGAPVAFLLGVDLNQTGTDQTNLALDVFGGGTTYYSFTQGTIGTENQGTGWADWVGAAAYDAGLFTPIQIGAAVSDDTVIQFHFALNSNNGPDQLFLIRATAQGEPIPEPATMLLLGSGLIGLAGYGRKKFLRK